MAGRLVGLGPFDPVANVTPFTYRDGDTYLSILEKVRNNLDDVVVSVNETIDATNAQNDTLVTQVNQIADIANSAVDASLDAVNRAMGAEQRATDAANLVGAPASAAMDTYLGGNAAGLVGQVQTSVKRGDLVVRVRDHGAVLDGVADDTTAAQAALDAAATLGAPAVVEWVGRLKVSTLSLPSNVTLRGRGSSSVIVQTGSATNLIDCQGTIGAPVSVTADVVPGATSITMSSTAGLKPGDIIVLSDNVFYSPSDPTYKSGEMLTVKDVVDNFTVNLLESVSGSIATAFGAYTTANTATVKKVTPRKGSGVADCVIEGDVLSGTTLINAAYVDRFTVSRVDIIKGGGAGIVVDGCRDSVIFGCSVSNLVDLLPSHVGYAIAAKGPCSNLFVALCVMRNCRHGFTTMGTEHGHPVTVNVKDCIAVNMTIGNFDTHSAGAYITFSGLTTVGGGVGSAGITIRSGRTRVVGCNVRNSKGGGIQITEGVARDVEISNNVISDPAGMGINIQEKPISNIVIAHNRISRTNSHGINVPKTLSNVEISNNILTDIGGGGFGIQCNNVSGLVITRNRLNRIAADGIRVTADAPKVEISDNVVRNVGMTVTGRSCIQSFTGGPASSGWVIIGNRCGNDVGVGSANSAVSCAGNLTGSWVSDNRATGAFIGAVFDTTTNLAERNYQFT